jgi:hypothetical protein
MILACMVGYNIPPLRVCICMCICQCPSCAPISFYDLHLRVSRVCVCVGGGGGVLGQVMWPGYVYPAVGLNCGCLSKG